MVTPSILREHEEGDVYEYVQYTRGDKVIGDSRDYSLLWGFMALAIEIIINFVLVYLLWFYVDTQGKLRKKKKREFYAPVDYAQLSAKELYKLCRGRGLRIMESKRKKKIRNIWRNVLTLPSYRQLVSSLTALRKIWQSMPKLQKKLTKTSFF